MRHHPPLHPDESEPIALNPLLRGVDLAVDRLIRRDCFTGRTLDILDELREELLAVSDTPTVEGESKMTLDDLRKIAQAAAEGPWVRDGTSVLGAREEHDLNTGPARLATMMMPWERERMEANAEFIATFNPQKVLEMIDTLRGAEIRLDHAKTVIDRLQARLAAVEKLHSPVEAIAANGDTITVCNHCVGDLAYVFDEQVNWPCPTIKAVRGD